MLLTNSKIDNIDIFIQQNRCKGVKTLDIKQLKTFLTIARLQSFTLAAQNLGYAQSTITTQIQLLEKNSV